MSDDDTPTVPESIPLVWKDGVSGRTLKKGRTIVQPSQDEAATFRPGVVTCGECWYFDLESGQKKMVEERFPERLVREEQWQMHHLGASFDMLGLCGASGGDTVTSAVAPKCDQYRPRRGRLKVIKGAG